MKLRFSCVLLAINIAHLLAKVDMLTPNSNCVNRSGMYTNVLYTRHCVHDIVFMNAFHLQTV
jgi:hypothetical protein